MIIEYTAGQQDVGESLRTISKTVHSVCGRSITYAGFKTILERRKLNKFEPGSPTGVPVRVKQPKNSSKPLTECKQLLEQSSQV